MFDFWEATEEYISLIEQYMPHSVAMQKAWLLWRTFLVEGIPTGLLHFVHLYVYVVVTCMYVFVCMWCVHIHTCVLMFLFCNNTGSPRWIHLTKTESQSIYTALQSSDISEIARALNEQQVTMVTTI